MVSIWCRICSCIVGKVDNDINMTIKEKIKQFEKRAVDIEKTLKKHELFGNEQLIKIGHEITRLIEQLKNGKKCDECDGKGEVYHDCYCNLCEFNGDFINCDECNGDGII